MLVNSVGVYATIDGNIAYVTQTDGYRRCYGYMKDTPDMEMSWYTEEGNVRHGLSCGPNFDNRLQMKLRTPLPKDAHEFGKQAQRERFEKHVQRCQDIVNSWPEWKRRVYG